MSMNQSRRSWKVSPSTSIFMCSLNNLTNVCSSPIMMKVYGTTGGAPGGFPGGAPGGAPGGFPGGDSEGPSVEEVD